MNLIFTQILSLMKNIPNTPMLAILIALISWQHGETLKLTHKAGTDHAYNVVASALEDAKTEADIIAIVEEWFTNTRPAQLGATRTLCDYAPNRLNDLVKPETAKMLCRITG